MVDPDPTSLLSAIMGTIATLYAIFIAIFILIFQSLPTHKKKYYTNKTTDERKEFNEKYNNQNDLFRTFFIVLAWLVVAFETYNGMLIYFVSDSIFGQYEYLLLVSYAFFIVTLVYIIGFSYGMVNFIISLERGNPTFYKYNPFKQIAKHDFFDVIIFLSIFFLMMVISNYWMIKNREFTTVNWWQELIAVFISLLLASIFLRYCFHKSDSMPKSSIEKYELPKGELNFKAPLTYYVGTTDKEGRVNVTEANAEKKYILIEIEP